MGGLKRRVGFGGGTALFLGAALAWSLSASSEKKSAPASLPGDDWQTTPDFTEADVEAAARMIASENPSKSRELHSEQIWTQLRARKPGQSLFDRITAGSSFGPQGEKSGSGGLRPVATTNTASPEQRQFARDVLAGKYPSKLAGARKFFEPAVQDRAFAIGQIARAKQQAGEALTEQEQRLIKYKRSADNVRDKWRGEGARFVDTVDGIEFYT